MGKIRNRTTGQTRQLEAEHVIGRASTSALRLGERFVSAQHGNLRWTGDHWELKDLASTNGTYLDGERIKPSEHHRLRLGSRIAFGRPEPEWELVDRSPPVIMAVPIDDGDPVLLDEELIAIPSADEPRATIYRAADGSWILEQSMSAAPITDQQVRRGARPPARVGRGAPVRSGGALLSLSSSHAGTASPGRSRRRDPRFVVGVGLPGGPIA
jgi:hypothetical protein